MEKEKIFQVCIEDGLGLTKIEREQKEPISNERLDTIFDFIVVMAAFFMIFGCFTLMILV